MQRRQFAGLALGVAAHPVTLRATFVLTVASPRPAKSIRDDGNGGSALDSIQKWNKHFIERLLWHFRSAKPEGSRAAQQPAKGSAAQVETTTAIPRDAGISGEIGAAGHHCGGDFHEEAYAWRRDWRR